jgi:acyl-CoA dehydrogenase
VGVENWNPESSILNPAFTLEFGVEKLFRDASLFLHRDATVDISRFKIVKAMFRDTAGVYAEPEQ